LAVSDDDIKNAELDFARFEGLFVEPSSATTLAALRLLISRQRVSKDEKIVLMATGTGFKDMNTAMSLCDDIPRIPFKTDAMFEAVRKINRNIESKKEK
jgi:threonine synthase